MPTIRFGPFAAILLLLTSCEPETAPAGAATPQTKTATQGLNAAAMSRTVNAAARLPRLRSLITLRDGKTPAEHRFNGGPPLDRPVNIVDRRGKRTPVAG